MIKKPHHTEKGWSQLINIINFESNENVINISNKNIYTRLNRNVLLATQSNYLTPYSIIILTPSLF